MRLSTIPIVAAMVSLSMAQALAAHAGPKVTTSRSAQQTHGGPKGTTGKQSGPHQTTTPTTTPVSPTTPINPVARRVSSNHGLMPKVTALLPPGMTLDQASFGFKNQGQFIAALHVSHNLGIPFADLKTAMTGITPVLGPTPLSTPATTSPTTPLLSLGGAINKLRPSANSATEATTAEHQATRDLGETKTATTTTSTTATTHR